MNTRVGKFYVSTSMLDNACEELAATLARMAFIPTRVEAVWHRRSFEYIGLSHAFREVPPGAVTPEYHIIVHEDEDGIISHVEVQEMTSDDPLSSTTLE